MKSLAGMCAVVIVVLSFFPQIVSAEEKGDVLSKITTLTDTYGKKTVLAQIIGNNEDNFTIRLNNQLMRSPNPLRGINEAYIDAGTIDYDMKRYRMTVDELENRMVRYNQEKASQKEKQAQERLEKQEQARKRQLLIQKRLQEESDLENAFEQAIGRPIEEEAASPQGLPSGK
jgi:predicted transglutaminase-like protease